MISTACLFNGIEEVTDFLFFYFSSQLWHPAIFHRLFWFGVVILL